MQAKDLTKTNFSKWGDFVSAEEKAGISTTDECNYVGNIAVLNLTGNLSASILEPFKRDIILSQMEKHCLTAEICVAIKNDCIIFVAKDKDGVPDVASVEAFNLKEGDTVVYNANVWHWIPYCIKEQSCKQLIIYTNKTGENDFYASKLPSPIHLEI